MTGSAPEISVVLPCLDERDAVGVCVREALDAMQRSGLCGEVLVVDNGSTDDSADVAAAAGARVVRESRRGYGRALRTGFIEARGQVVVMADADGTYDLTKIPELCRPVLAGDLDVNLATRLEGASHETMPFLHRTVGTPVLTFLTTRASGRPLTKDSQTGYRAFRRDRMLELGLASNGMELASEMLIKAARADLHIGNVDIPYRARIGDSKLDTWSDGWRHLKLIFLLAPDILLVVPGLTLAAAGVLALILSFFQPSGVEIGSARWQPVFFSGIAIVLGLQMFCAGAIVTSSSPVAHRGRLSYNFLRDQLLPRRAIRGGLITVVLGFAIDTGLFFWWLFGTTSDPIIGVRFALASLAQTLMLLGGSLVVFGLVIRFARASNNEVLAARLDERTREPA